VIEKEINLSVAVYRIMPATSFALSLNDLSMPAAIHRPFLCLGVLRDLVLAYRVAPESVAGLVVQAQVQPGFLVSCSVAHGLALPIRDLGMATPRAVLSVHVQPISLAPEPDTVSVSLTRHTEHSEHTCDWRH
jgi:hypothetical protein